MKYVDLLSGYVAGAVSWLIPVLIAELVYDTAARYVFNAPTAWSYDVSYMLYGVVFMFGAAYVLHVDRHVRIDVLYDRMPPRARAVVDALGYLVFFFPAMAALVYFGTIFALNSWALRELSGDSMWQPAIYPFKAVLPVASGLLLVQGVVQFARCLAVIVRGPRGDGKP